MTTEMTHKYLLFAAVMDHQSWRQKGAFKRNSLPAAPEFVHLIRSQESIPSLAESITWNRFLGSLNVYKFGLRGSHPEPPSAVKTFEHCSIMKTRLSPYL